MRHSQASPEGKESKRTVAQQQTWHIKLLCAEGVPLWSERGPLCLAQNAPGDGMQPVSYLSTNLVDNESSHHESRERHTAVLTIG